MSSSGINVPIIVSSFVFFFLLCPLQSAKFNYTNQHKDEANNLKHIRAQLKKINKPAVKTIQSPHGDIIDCILTHQQLAFDHPLLKGQKPWDPPKMPKGQTSTVGMYEEIFQIWSMTNESCPEDTIPIKRTTEQDLLRISSNQSLVTRHDLNHYTDELAGGSVIGAEYYGAIATLNVWNPSIEYGIEYSLSSVRILAGSYGIDLDRIEIGWQVNPSHYGDAMTRVFIHWDGAQPGCYDLQCPGFVQTNRMVILGDKFKSVSSYNGLQVELHAYIYQNTDTGDWWLELENLPEPIGYWPSTLFRHLKDGPGTRVDFEGQIRNYRTSGAHTATGMGSGRFANEGLGKAAYFRNLQVKDEYNRIFPISDTTAYPVTQNCYGMQKQYTDEWGFHFFYGGPGRNPMCP